MRGATSILSFVNDLRFAQQPGSGVGPSSGVEASNQPRAQLQKTHTLNMTGTSTSTPTTAVNAAPEDLHTPRLAPSRSRGRRITAPRCTQTVGAERAIRGAMRYGRSGPEPQAAATGILHSDETARGG